MQSNYNQQTYLKLSKEFEDTGNVLVILDGVGCISVCFDEGHADYVIGELVNGRLKLGKRGLERNTELIKE